MGIIFVLTLLLTSWFPLQGVSTSAIEKDDVRQSIRDKMPEIQNCYQSMLESGGSAEGKLVLEWEILSSGKVGTVTVLESLEPSLDKCITAKIKNWNFPKPPENTTAVIKYPFVFKKK